uniref:Uncharacterized protein n=1 Tax=Oryza punctata TaxID=4537 RepID=A0A0E0MP70_ORYPU
MYSTMLTIHPYLLEQPLENRRFAAMRITPGEGQMVWGLTQRWIGIDFPLPAVVESSLTDWWMKTRMSFRTGYRSILDSMRKPGGSMSSSSKLLLTRTAGNAPPHRSISTGRIQDNTVVDHPAPPAAPPVSVSTTTTSTRDTEEAKDHLSNLALVQGARSTLQLIRGLKKTTTMQSTHFCIVRSPVSVLD